jgi:hypothetical protein
MSVRPLYIDKLALASQGSAQANRPICIAIRKGEYLTTVLYELQQDKRALASWQRIAHTNMFEGLLPRIQAGNWFNAYEWISLDLEYVFSASRKGGQRQ